MAKFLSGQSPILTSMIGGKTPDIVTETIEKSINQGAEALCLLLQELSPEYKTRETYKKIFDSAKGRPIYAANYIRNNSQTDLTDDILAKQLIEMAESGADLIDIRCDMFSPSVNEVTKNTFAVQKQKELISEIHDMGAEVLMSTHIFEYTSPEEVLEIALLQQERGVDIAKIVTVANSEKELDASLETIMLLKKNLDIPFLHLCNGSHCRKHRLLGPFLGSCFYLCLENSKTQGPQPTIEEAKAMREKFRLLEENNG